MPQQTAKYSSLIGNIYIFNLMVGTGALTLPLAFSQAGITFGILTFSILCLFSFISASWVIEVMATANAITANTSNDDDTERFGLLDSDESLVGDQIIRRRPRESRLNSPSRSPSNLSPNSFKISEKFEMGKMASLFFNKFGLILFYICIIVYLYGDLAIYAAAIPKNLRDLICNFHDEKLPDLCWKVEKIENLEQTSSSSVHKILKRSIIENQNIPISELLNSRKRLYQILLVTFICLIGPFTFFNVEKTKFLQIFTLVFRWVAFCLMILISGFRIYNQEGEGAPILTGKISGLPMLFGCSIYSFMNHHSLPAMVTPIENKKNLMRNVGRVYVCILTFYILLSITAVFCFDNKTIMDMYTLNFINDNILNKKFPFLKYLFGLFPVLTLGTSFPIIAVTLSNNLKNLFEIILKHFFSFEVGRYGVLDINRGWNRSRICNIFVKFFFNIGIPVLTIIPPTIIASCSSNLEMLVSVTGSYAGAGIQYIIPAFLVYSSRKYLKNNFTSVENLHKSPFYGNFYIGLTLFWCVVCVVFVSVNLGTKADETITSVKPQIYPD